MIRPHFWQRRWRHVLYFPLVAALLATSAGLIILLGYTGMAMLVSHVR